MKVSQQKHNEGLKVIDENNSLKLDIKWLKEGLKTIAGLGNKTGKSGEQFLADIAIATLNKTNEI